MLTFLGQGEEEEEHYVKEATDKGSKAIQSNLTNGTELVSNIRLAAQNLQVGSVLFCLPSWARTIFSASTKKGGGAKVLPDYLHDCPSKK